jgi:phospholipid/cholesterol/gamma-HCH transport system substrate-binding protein
MSQEIRLALFITLTLTLLFAGVFYIGGSEMRFQSTYKLQSQFQNVVGLNEGADVRVGGIHTGMVKKIDLPKRSDGKVTVVMVMQSKTREIVRKDSVAAIKSEGLLGDKYVEIAFGTPNSEPLKDGDTIPSQPPLDVSDLFAKANRLLESSGDTADNLQEITAKINEGRGSIGALLNDRTVYNQASKATANLADDTEALKHNFLTRGFFKDRGYQDKGDLTKYTLAKLPSAPPTRTFSFVSSNLFDKEDNAKLKNEKSLSEAGKFMESNPFGMAVVSASAGPKGDSEKVKTLTEARAVAVRNYLVQNFRMDDTKLRTIGRGKTEDGSDAGKLEILIYSAPAGK